MIDNDDKALSSLSAWTATTGPVWGKQSTRSSDTSSQRTNSDAITADYRLHKSMLANATSAVNIYPYCYLRFSPAQQHVSTSNSSDSLIGLARSYYERAHNQLQSLRNETDDVGDELMEEAAINSAEEILVRLQRFNYTPPELSWHGGDAVVMLWAAGDMTYAITVTDGEWGYVATRGSTQVRLVDSLRVERFALEDMR